MFVARPGSMVTKCPSKYTAKPKGSRSLPAELGRAALVVSLGLIVYALVAGSAAAVTADADGSPSPLGTR